MDPSRPLDEATLRLLRERHGVPAEAPAAVDAPAAANRVIFLGREHVLRVPHDASTAEDLVREARVVPFARAAGVRTPRIVAFDASGVPFGLPYMIVERVHGANLARVARSDPAVYRDLGRDLARLHRAYAPPELAAALPRDPHPDPRPAAAALVDRGLLVGDGGAWLLAWLDALAAQGWPPLPPVPTHGDAGPSNVLVEEGGGAYMALVDWGDAALRDPAAEFAKLPLRTVPAALEGYREAGGVPEVSEARVLWYHLAWAVLALGRAPSARDGTWSAPPNGRLIELARFFAGDPGPGWARLVPPA